MMSICLSVCLSPTSMFDLHLAYGVVVAVAGPNLDGEREREYSHGCEIYGWFQ